jgi:hypothetical protein
VAVIKGRADVRVKHVSRLRRSGVLCVGYPTLPRRANLCAPTALVRDAIVLALLRQVATTKAKPRPGNRLNILFGKYSSTGICH